MRQIYFLIALLLPVASLLADDGYRLWLRYDQLENAAAREAYIAALPAIFVGDDSPGLASAEKELRRGMLWNSTQPSLLKSMLIQTAAHQNYYSGTTTLPGITSSRAVTRCGKSSVISTTAVPLK